MNTTIARGSTHGLAARSTRPWRRRREQKALQPTTTTTTLTTKPMTSSTVLSFFFSPPPTSTTTVLAAVPPSRDGGPTASTSSSSSPSSSTSSSSSASIPPPPAVAASRRSSGVAERAPTTLPPPPGPTEDTKATTSSDSDESDSEGKSCLLSDAEFYATNPGPLAAIARAASRSLAASSSSSSSTRKAAAADDDDSDSDSGSESGSESSGSWSRLPARYRVAGATAMAFVVCNMDKVNMSVAIIPMSHDFGWSPTTSGLVQSAFFAGYALTQVPGGYFSARRGGAFVLPLGVALWSLATAAVPLAAGVSSSSSSTGSGASAAAAASVTALPVLLLLCRAAVGAGEGLAPAAATDMIARATPTAERARTVSFVFGGLHAGSLVGLLAAPPLIDAFGWRAVFYGFGGVGLLWCLWWRSVLRGVEEDEPETRAALAHASDDVDVVEKSPKEDNDSETTLTPSKPEQRVPWRAFLRNGPYRALAATHFANNWLHYVLMAWLPTYFRDTLSLSLDQAAAVSLLPPAAALAVASAAGPLADALLESGGLTLGAARKAAQAAAFLPPAAALVAAGTLARGDGPATVALVAAALGLSSFSLAGLYCNHADLSPRYAPLLLGGTTAVGAVPGVVGVALTGYFLDASGGDWSLALFAPTSALLVAGTAVFTAWGSAEEQDWSKDDGPLWIERAWGRLMSKSSERGGSGGGGGGDDDDEKKDE